MALVNAGAAELIEESDLTGGLLTKKVDEMLSDREKLKKYSECAKRMAITNAGERIYAIVKKTLESRK
jgi:UDP-N-acetylglucosamine--N-acetylmuramyl-(pentapeptide) pyrophosphoryl-undecaprenol N-acetylglucosamine transferase